MNIENVQSQSAPAKVAEVALTVTTPAANPYYPVAAKATRILDVIIAEGGVIQVDQRSRSGLNWTGLASPPRSVLGAGQSVEFTFSIPEGSEALFAVQARDWTGGYPVPNLIELGKLDPMAGNGREVDTSNSPLAYKTSEISCEFVAPDKLITRLYRFKKDLGGKVTRDPNPVFSTTLDLAALREDPQPGRAHAVLRLPEGVAGQLKFTKGSIEGQTLWNCP